MFWAWLASAGYHKICPLQCFGILDFRTQIRWHIWTVTLNRCHGPSHNFWSSFLQILCIQSRPNLIPSAIPTTPPSALYIHPGHWPNLFTPADLTQISPIWSPPLSPSAICCTATLSSNPKSKNTKRWSFLPHLSPPSQTCASPLPPPFQHNDNTWTTFHPFPSHKPPFSLKSRDNLSTTP